MRHYPSYSDRSLTRSLASLLARKVGLAMKSGETALWFIFYFTTLQTISNTYSSSMWE